MSFAVPLAVSRTDRTRRERGKVRRELGIADAIQRKYRYKTKKHSPIQQLSCRYKRRMPIRISIRPERQQNENLKKIGNRDCKVVVFCIAFHPILDLRNTKEQEHQSVYEICLEQIRPAIDSAAEKKGRPSGTVCNHENGSRLNAK